MCTRQTRHAKAQHYSDNLHQNTSNPANFWKVINNIFQPPNHHQPSNITKGDITLTNPTDIANAFNDYFVGCATNLLAKRSPNHKPESHPGSTHIAPPPPNTAHNF
ncbi:hypothetical protein FKM82_024680 [Ascaphus truei]